MFISQPIWTQVKEAIAWHLQEIIAAMKRAIQASGKFNEITMNAINKLLKLHRWAKHDGVTHSKHDVLYRAVGFYGVTSVLEEKQRRGSSAGCKSNQLL